VTTQNEGDKYDSYPSTRSNDSRHKQKRATKCKEQLLACQTKADLDAFKTSGEFSENEYKWVWHNLLSGAEQSRITAIANTEQPSLNFDLTYEDLQVGIKVKVIKSDHHLCDRTGEVTRCFDKNKIVTVDVGDDYANFTPKDLVIVH